MTFLTLLLNPRVLAAAALVAALAGAYLYVDHRAFKRGADAAEARWQAREATELARVNVEIERLNREARAAERAHADNLAEIASKYEKDLQNAKSTRDAALAAVRAGKLVLRDPGAAPCQGAGAGGPGEAPAGAGRRDGGAGSQLSAAFTQFLVDFASEADAVVRQLTACQAVVSSDRQRDP
jgi:prophage endopeptidase